MLILPRRIGIDDAIFLFRCIYVCHFLPVLSAFLRFYNIPRPIRNRYNAAPYEYTQRRCCRCPYSYPIRFPPYPYMSVSGIQAMRPAFPSGALLCSGAALYNAIYSSGTSPCCPPAYLPSGGMTRNYDSGNLSIDTLSLSRATVSLPLLRIIRRQSVIKHSYLLMPTQRHSIRIQKSRRQRLVPYQVITIPRPIAFDEIYIKPALTE